MNKRKTSAGLFVYLTDLLSMSSRQAASKHCEVLEHAESIQHTYDPVKGSGQCFLSNE